MSLIKTISIAITLLAAIGTFQAHAGNLAQSTTCLNVKQAALIGSAGLLSDSSARFGAAVGPLDQPGQGLVFERVPKSAKLAVHYSTLHYGTFSLYVNGIFARKINLHSTGEVVGSYIYAIVSVSIPKRATVELKHDPGDVGWAIDYVLVGNGNLGLKPDIWNLPALPIAKGPYLPNWTQLSKVYAVPEWYRDAKFGAWAHWDPQSVPEQGDWFARNMYLQGSPQYDYSLATYGPQSVFGYKDLCNLWRPIQWDPDAMVKLCKEMGAKFFVAMGAHHDNFDCYDSTYQPWNSVNVGPKQDIVGTWEKLAEKYKLRFGIGFHDTPSRTWSEFMPPRYGSDSTGKYAGVPYDGMQTIADGKGKWWEGMDPVDLNGPPHSALEPSLDSPYANQFMWRIDDAINKYHPDLLYFDDSAGDSIRELGGVIRGLGNLSPQLTANFYNKSLLWNGGKMDVVVNLKDVGGRWNSFSDNPSELPLAERSFVKSAEVLDETTISDVPFGYEASIGQWHYLKGQNYLSANSIIRMLVDTVSKNGSLVLSLTQHGDGHLDEEVISTVTQVGAWMHTNGEAIYASRPFDICSEGDIRFTRANGFIYAILLSWPSSNTVDISALKTGGPTIGNVTAVSLLGDAMTLSFRQDNYGLHITTTETSKQSEAYVLKVAYDKAWINDDDPGMQYRGWIHQANLGDGSYNNDVHYSTVKGDTCTYAFDGTGIDIIGPTAPGLGKMNVFVDDHFYKQVDVSPSSSLQVQQRLFSVTGLPTGTHVIKIVNASDNPVEIDALRLRS